jgi:hypothetical protein
MQGMTNISAIPLAFLQEEDVGKTGLLPSSLEINWVSRGEY